MNDQIHIDEKLQEFCGVERWERNNDIKKQESKIISHPNRSFLIKKYKSKFPSVAPVALEQRKVIRL